MADEVLQPGGAQIMVDNAGKDVTRLFKGIHPEGTLELNLEASQRVGRLDEQGECLLDYS